MGYPPPNALNEEVIPTNYSGAVILKMPEKKPPICFQSDERYFCQGKCAWSGKCKTLTAVWLRRN